jgi:hypothetical protein
MSDNWYWIDLRHFVARMCTGWKCELITRDEPSLAALLA